MSSNQEIPPLQHATLDKFVENVIAVLWERPTDGSQTLTWCPKWWCHDEAVFRLTALWTAWEHMRIHDGPTAMAAWLTRYADPIMAIVLDAEAGPFRGCKSDRGHKTLRPHTNAALPCEPAPTNLFASTVDDAEEDGMVQLQHATLDKFVEKFIVRVWERPTDGSQTLTWCPKWWCHDEAVFRLTALWTAWEHMRVHDGPTAMAAWLVEYADPIMAIVLDAEAGPFRGCKSDRGHKTLRPHTNAALPCEPAPSGVFDERT